MSVGKFMVLHLCMVGHDSDCDRYISVENTPAHNACTHTHMFVVQLGETAMEAQYVQGDHQDPPLPE